MCSAENYSFETLRLTVADHAENNMSGSTNLGQSSWMITGPMHAMISWERLNNINPNLLHLSLATSGELVVN